MLGWKLKINDILVFVLVNLLILGTVGGYALAQKPEIELHLATTHPPTNPIGQGLVAFVKAVEEESKGRIKIIPHFYGELSKSERDYVDALSSGDLDMMCIMPSILSSYSSKNYYELYDLPFLFDSAEGFASFMSSSTMRKIDEEVYKEFGMMPLGGGMNLPEKCTRNIISSKPFKSLKGLQGLKIRVIESPIYVKTYKALGFKPVPLPFGEVYSALQTKLVDAVEHTLSIGGKSMGFFDNAKYMIWLHPMRCAMVLFVSGKTWESLSLQDQEILKKANEAFREGYWCESLNSFNRDFEEVKKKGVKFIDFPEEELAKAKEIVLEATKDDYEKVGKMFDFLGYDIFDATKDPEKYGGKMLEFHYYSPETWETLSW